jgi:hypothetical protein
MTYLCDGSKFPAFPAICSDQTLQTSLGPDGTFQGFEVVDVADQLAAFTAALGG